MTVVVVKTRKEGKVVANIIFTDDGEIHVHDLAEDVLLEIS